MSKHDISTLHFYIFPFTPELFSFIFCLRFLGGGTIIADGIRSAVNEQFVSSRGDRSAAKNVLVVITDTFETNADAAILVSV